MNVIVNGASRETRAPDIAELLIELGYGDSVVATALNGEFVPATARSRARLGDGDRVEVLAPMQGG